MMDNENKNRSLGKMSFDEIQRLSPEDFRTLMKAEETNYYSQLEDLGDPLYAGFDFEKKVSFWETVLHRQMRYQSESGLDEYAIYSPEWYAAIKRLEPVFDEIMDKVFERPGFQEWTRQKYLERVAGKADE